MSRDTFDKILDNIDIPVNEICLYLHGEPFLNKSLDYFVSQIDKKTGVLTTLYSNGYNIDLDLLNKILVFRKIRFSFSMDIVSKEGYEQIRQPALYEKAVESLEKIDRLFTIHNRKFEINMVVDYASFGQAQNFSEKLFAQFGNLKKITLNIKFPWPEQFFTGELSDGRISKNRPLCKQIMGGVSVYWNGDVTICSYDFSGKLIIGNLKDKKLSEIYNSLSARRIRKYHFLRKFSELPVCNKCILPRYKTALRSINRMKNLPDNNPKEQLRNQYSEK